MTPLEAVKKAAHQAAESAERATQEINSPYNARRSASAVAALPAEADEKHAYAMALNSAASLIQLMNKATGDTP